MAGGTHADHSDIEKRTLETYSATSKPFTDAQIDAMCVEAEAGIVTYLSYGSSLPATANTQWKQIIVDIVLNMMDLALARKRGRGSTTHTDESGVSESYPRYGATAYTKDIIRRAQWLASSVVGVTYGDTTD